MKKKIALIGLLALTLPMLALAAAPTGCNIASGTADRINKDMPTYASTCATACDFTTNDSCGLCCVLNTIYNITDWVFVFLIALVAIFVIAGAFFFITSAGDPEKTKTGRNYILYAAVGLVVAFLARAVPGLVTLATGFKQ